MRFKKFIVLLFTFLIVISFWKCNYSVIRQELNYSIPYMNWSLRQMSLIKFDFDALYFSRDKKSRIDVYLQVGYNKLAFLKDQDKYIANYSYRIIILDEKTDSVIIDKEFDKEIIKPNWKEEYKQHFDFNLNYFEVPAGNYIVGVKITERSSEISNFKIKKVSVKSNDMQGFTTSDVLILRNVGDEKNKKQITPVISSNIPYLDQDFIYSFNEIYFSKQADNLSVTYSLEKIFYDSDHTPESIYNRQSNYPNYDYAGRATPDRLLFRKDTVLKNLQPTSQLILSYPLIEKQGKFRIKIVFNDGITSDSIITNFIIRSFGFPKIISFADKIKSLSYIMNVNEKKLFDTLKNEEEIIVQYKEFLNNMGSYSVDEYFRRIEYVNERFSSTSEGWQTPIGILFIICGEPDNYSENTLYYQKPKFNAAVEVIEYQSREKYPSYERQCYINPLNKDFILFWRDCIERWRRK